MTHHKKWNLLNKASDSKFVTMIIQTQIMMLGMNLPVTQKHENAIFLITTILTFLSQTLIEQQ